MTALGRVKLSGLTATLVWGVVSMWFIAQMILRRGAFFIHGMTGCFLLKAKM